uniref:Uncharacterized protein n=1 Tax=Setaria viridis TaxID=4556 RepID=A0A4U6UX63_SETVI|nr:hypothetical protein SEVIR_4G169600v2 [Setaria viridis]
MKRAACSATKEKEGNHAYCWESSQNLGLVCCSKQVLEVSNHWRSLWCWYRYMPAVGEREVGREQQAGSRRARAGEGPAAGKRDAVE